ncbi:MAG TPA: acylneuraminate cytidylyltransferase [Lachnospiraceae bacterium]|nr:acylneuraminate cytidylyltransferase [Lachnospiraceae bacterium]
MNNITENPSESDSREYRTVAFIPVRGGSKSIPLKNIRETAGRPLVYWTAKAACDCRYIDRVFVATDSDRIRETVEGLGLKKVTVIGRSRESATDNASTESALLEFAESHEFENVFLIQATSPLLTGEELDRGYELYSSDNTDSVLSVVRQKRFNWEPQKDGTVKPSNYDVFHRPRRQEFEGYLVENGAFYITSREKLLKSGNRISGRIRACEMSEESYFEIDEPSDLVMIEELLKRREKTGTSGSAGALCNKPRQGGIKGKPVPEIRLFLTDCDGCLTDGGMYYSEKGDELKRFNTLDGMGFKLLRERGILTGIVTAEDMRLNRKRAEKLKLDVIVNGVTDKLEAVRRIADKYGVALENTAYVGDDINDIEAIGAVGFGACPSNACEGAKEAAGYIAAKSGGNGAVREIIEYIIAGSEQV